MSKLVYPLIALVGALSQGCVMTSQTKVAKGSALVHPTLPYAVPYDDEEKKSVLGEDWELETYRVTKSEYSGDVTIERKEGHTATYDFDLDDDDKSDGTLALPNPDMVFVSRKTNARIEVTSLLLDKRSANKELRVLMSDIADSASGSRSLFVGFGRIAGGVEKRFASRLLESSKATLQENEGLAATIERADVDQLQLNPNARWRRSRVLLVHAPFDYYVKAGSLQRPNGVTFHSSKVHKYRVLFVVEYTNSPDDFEAQYPELLRLLNKLHFLSDDNVMDLMGPALQDCLEEKQGKAELALAISETGEPSYDGGSGWRRLCLDTIYPLFHFAATGATRKVSRSYDYAKPLKPAWLATATYTEERGTPAPGAAPSSPSSPAGTTAAPPTTPVTTPEAPADGATPAPTAPSAPPAPPAPSEGTAPASAP